MVNRDQLEQTPEGKQVLALMDENFSAEDFQKALTLIEQRYTEEQPVWDIQLNREGKMPFVRTTPAQRLLVFFEHPNQVSSIKTELVLREAEAAIRATEAALQTTAVIVEPPVKAKRKTKPKAAKRKPRKSPKKPPQKRLTVKGRRTKPKKTRTKIAKKKKKKP